jgi:hypothetical protein
MTPIDRNGITPLRRSGGRGSTDGSEAQDAVERGTGEPHPCIRQSPRAPASRGPAALRDAPDSMPVSPGDPTIPRGSSSQGTTASARNGHPPSRSCKLGSSSGRQPSWSPSPGSSALLLTYPTAHPSPRGWGGEEASAPPLCACNGDTLAASQGVIHMPGGHFFWSELPRTPLGRSSIELPLGQGPDQMLMRVSTPTGRTEASGLSE